MPCYPCLPPPFNASPIFSEYYSFSDVSPGAIGNVAGRAMLPLIFGALDAFTNSSQPMKFRGVGISYKVSKEPHKLRREVEAKLASN